jgi:PilZ domain
VDQRRKISARKVVEDIRSGTSVTDLLHKYALSETALRRLLDKLLHSRFLDQRELDNWEALNHNVTVIRGVRQETRIPIDFPLRVQDCDHPYEHGLVRNLSQTGIGVSGIRARVGETRTLLVRLNGRVDRSFVRFEAKCRWVIQTEGDVHECTAGFEITGIDDAARSALRKVMAQ